MEELHLGDVPPPLAEARFVAHGVVARVRADGARVYRSPLALGELPAHALVALERGASTHPQRALLVARDPAGAWETLRYGDALRRARAIAQGLIAYGGTAHGPILVLAPNGIAHGALALGAHLVGIPIAPIPPEYARVGADRARFARLVATIAPAFAYVDPSLVTDEVLAVCAGVPLVTDLATLEREPTDDVATRASRVTLDTVAKILFTSGSTGDAKGVITTHRMIVANQVAFAHVWPVREPPVLVDWLPWSHSFGGNKSFHLALHRGGTLVVDDGRPTPRGFARTLENLREIGPTIYFGVPRSFALLVPALETDRVLRERFFSRLHFAFSAGAALPPAAGTAFSAIAREATARDVPLFGGWGATETGPGATCVHDPSTPQGSLGVPLPGVEIALVALEQGDELRVRGDNVTPGYWRDAAATARAFDADGFYRSGDAGALVDASAPERGFAFGGRLAEHFKLSSGSWVVASELRARFLEAAEALVDDAVVTGADRDDAGVLVYLKEPGGAADAYVRRRIAEALASCNARARTHAERIARATIVRDAPSATTGEVTPKGTIARGVALRLRAGTIAALHDGAAEVDPILA